MAKKIGFIGKNNLLFQNSLKNDEDNNEINLFSQKIQKKENRIAGLYKLNNKNLEKNDSLHNNSQTNKTSLINKNNELNKIFLGVLKNNFIVQNGCNNNEFKVKKKLIILPKVNKNKSHNNKNIDNKKEKNEDKNVKEEKKENKKIEEKNENEEKQDEKENEKIKNEKNNISSPEISYYEEIEQISDFDDINVLEQIDENEKTNENDTNTSIKQKDFENNINEKRIKNEKIKDWGIKVIYDILTNHILLKLQKSFFIIKYSKKQSIKNKGKNLFECYEKYKTKFNALNLKKYFLRFKMNSLKPQKKIEKINDLITELTIENDNIETPKKLKNLISQKPTESTNNDSISHNENVSKEENLQNIIPTPPIIPPPPPIPMAPLIFSLQNSNIPDITKNLPKLPKNVNTRKLQWQKINYDYYSNSFWSKIEERLEKTKNPVKLDFELLQNVFTVSKEKKIEKPICVQKINIITILDSKRLMNISIFLKKMKINKDKLQESIKSYDIDNKLDIDIIQTVNNIFPNNEEKRLLLEYKGDLTKLSEPDNFCRMLVSIENCKKILEILIFKKQLPEKINDILFKLNTLKECLSSINNSEQFKTILYLIRQIGNFLNEGTSNGNALGFSINFLDKLDLIKGFNKEKSSFLEIFTSIIKNKNENLLNFYIEFKKLDEASEFDKNELDNQISSIQKGITDIHKEKEKSKDEKYLIFLNNVENYCLAKMDCVNLTKKNLGGEIAKSILIFGENPKNFNLTNFIKIIKNFSEKFKKCLLDISQKETKLLRKIIIEEKKKIKNEDIKTSVSIDFKKLHGNTRKKISRKACIKNNLNGIREFVKLSKVKIRENNFLSFRNNEVKEKNQNLFNETDLKQKGVKILKNCEKKINIEDEIMKMIIKQHSKSEKKNI